MAAPATLTEQLDTFYATTWEERQRQAVDQIFGARPFFWWLMQEGRRVSQRGGRFLEVPLMYSRNDTITSFGRFGTFQLTPQDPLTSTVTNWKYIGGSVIRDWVGDQQNRGEYQIINRATTLMDQLILSLQEKMGDQIFGDGAGNGGLDLDGLDKLVQVDPTIADTVQNLSQSTNTWWRNVTTAASGAMDVFLLTDMRRSVRLVSEGVDYPDIGVTEPLVFEAYEAELLEFFKIEDRKGADAGFENFKFKGITIFWDPKCPAQRLYWLNSKYISLFYDPDVDFAMTDWKPIPGQLDRAAQVVYAGNLTTSRRSRQGILTGLV